MLYTVYIHILYVCMPVCILPYRIPYSLYCNIKRHKDKLNRFCFVLSLFSLCIKYAKKENKKKT